MKTGAELIAEERHRQVTVGGWTPEHDDKHCDGELSDVAAALAVHPDTTSEISIPVWGSKLDDKLRARCDDIRRLTIAGALIAAEIDRLQRAMQP